VKELRRLAGKPVNMPNGILSAYIKQIYQLVATRLVIAFSENIKAGWKNTGIPVNYGFG
jgi:ABC-type multidrug transport system permease subunit